jgi:AraC-like DNA-binding protein
MTILRYILLAYSILAIFIAGGLFFKRNSLANWTISFFVLLFGVEISVFLYSTSRLVEFFPDLYGLFYFPMGFLYGPLIWLHLQTIIRPGYSLRLRDGLHFLPFLLLLVWMWDILSLPAVARIEYSKLHFYDRMMPLNYARAIHQAIYALILVLVLFERRFRLSPKNQMYSLSIWTIYALAVAAVSWLTAFARNWRQFIWFYLIAYTMVLLIGFLLYTDPDFLNNLSKKYLNSGLKKADMNRIYSKIEKALVQEKAYLQRGLKLSVFAHSIDEKPHQISQTLSEYVQKNFNELLNQYRVEYAQELLHDPAFAHYKIEAIAHESGFNNKVSFNQSFLKNTGKTPSDFKKTAS